MSSVQPLTPFAPAVPGWLLMRRNLETDKWSAHEIVAWVLALEAPATVTPKNIHRFDARRMQPFASHDAPRWLPVIEGGEIVTDADAYLPPNETFGNGELARQQRASQYLEALDEYWRSVGLRIQQRDG